MALVNIDNDELVRMLVDRVEFWTDDLEVIALFEDYYENKVWSGCFEGAELDIMGIVDNDYVNWFYVGTREEVEADFGEVEDDRIYAQHDDLLLYYAC